MGGQKIPGQAPRSRWRGGMGFKIEFSPATREHLRALRKRDQQIILDAIASQPIHQPDQPIA